MVGVAVVGGGAAAAAVDVATGAALAAANNNALSAIVPPSSTEDEDAYIGTSVAFEGACIGTFADGAGPLGNGNSVKSAAGRGRRRWQFGPVGYGDRGGPRRFHRRG